MTEWKQKRFWKDAVVTEADNGYTVLLDTRTLKTPAKAAVELPTRAMAQAMADEWQAQEGVIDPLSMPVTRSVNAAIDKVRIQRAEVLDMLADYGSTDLLCYRAEGPDSLIQRQEAEWNPLLDWAERQFGARLNLATGVMYHAQPADALSALRQPLDRLSDFELTAAHDLISLSGSLVIGLAAWNRHMDPEALWRVSRLDEIWQAEQWGQDEEAEAAAETKQAAFVHAARFFDLAAADD